MEYQLKANLNTSCWLVGYDLFTSSSVTIESAAAAHWIISSDFGVDMRKQAVNGADQLRPRIVLLLHGFREVLGVHLVHLDRAMLPHFHGNRHCPRVPKSLDVHCAASMLARHYATGTGLSGTGLTQAADSPFRRHPSADKLKT